MYVPSWSYVSCFPLWSFLSYFFTKLGFFICHGSVWFSGKEFPVGGRVQYGEAWNWFRERVISGRRWRNSTGQYRQHNKSTSWSSNQSYRKNKSSRNGGTSARWSPHYIQSIHPDYLNWSPRMPCCCKHNGIDLKIEDWRYRDCAGWLNFAWLLWLFLWLCFSPSAFKIKSRSFLTFPHRLRRFGMFLVSHDKLMALLFDSLEESAITVVEQLNKFHYISLNQEPMRNEIDSKISWNIDLELVFVLKCGYATRRGYTACNPFYAFGIIITK